MGFTRKDGGERVCMRDEVREALRRSFKARLPGFDGVITIPLCTIQGRIPGGIDRRRLHAITVEELGLPVVDAVVHLLPGDDRRFLVAPNKSRDRHANAGPVAKVLGQEMTYDGFAVRAFRIGSLRWGTKDTVGQRRYIRRK